MAANVKTQAPAFGKTLVIILSAVYLKPPRYQVPKQLNNENLKSNLQGTMIIKQIN